jgi:adenylate kinase family enzyme
VLVVGVTGTGKTYFGAGLAERLGVRHVELDALHWGPDWAPAEPEVFRSKVSEAVQGEGWVVDGNYSEVQPIVLGRVDTVIWLNYPYRVVLRRLVARTARRVFRRERLWSGNRETFLGSLGPDSILWWQVKTFRRNRRRYRRLLADPRWAHLDRVEMRSQHEADRYLEALDAAGG